MSDIAIRVENLGKMYRIGAEERQPESLWLAVKQTALSPFEYLRRITRPPTEEETLWALRDVSFEVQRGEVLGIIGRNGAGKTTLLKILSRITEPTEGRAEIHGRVGSLLEVGTGFHPELTGRENIYLNGAILGMKREEIDRRFEEIVDFSGVEKFIDTPVKRYSSGMYVRLAFAVAAHLEPEILLVDEVLAVGDAAFQKKCLGKMEDVSSQGRTVLFVSHNMNSVRQLCERAILIDRGEIVADDEASEVVCTYLGTQQSEFEGAALDTWNIGHRPRPFFLEIQINGMTLPAELSIPTNHCLRIRMTGDTGGNTLRRFRSGIHIATQDGVRILSCGTPWSPLGDDIQINGGVALTCTIARLPLLPGRYFLSIGCSDVHGQVDQLENVCALSITPTDDVMGELVPTYKTHGYYLTESSWELEEV